MSAVYGGADCICTAQLMGWAEGFMCPVHPPSDRPAAAVSATRTTENEEKP